MLLRVFGLVLVLAVALVVAPSLALAEEKGDVTREGTLVKTEKHTITVTFKFKEKEKDRTYDVVDKAKISCDGKECSLEELGKHKGATVKLTVRGDIKERKVVEISAKTK